MINHIKNFINVYKNSLYYNKINKLFINTSIVTSCNIPSYIIYKKIWVLHFYNETTQVVEYYWFDQEEQIKQITQILNNFGYKFIVKEYEV